MVHHPLASFAQGDPRRIVAAIFLVCVTALPAAAQVAAKAEAPYVPTPVAIVDRMLTLAAIGPGDYVIDLGSGDGRLVTTAVAKYKARGGLGFEIDPKLVKEANERASNAGVGDRVRFVERDLFTADVSEATVVTLYLVPGMLGRVADKLLKELKPGTRVISHDYPLPSWKPVDVVEFETDEKVPITGTRRTMLLLYRVPDKTR
jgi:protein-L-isoaspartate O-methyltransferase